MIRQFILIFALFALNVNTNAETTNDPLTDYFGLEIEKIELEQELFGSQTKIEAVSIASLDLYEIDEELPLDFNTKNYLPKGFNAKDGMNDIDWNEVQLYELEEELDLGFNTENYLPRNFNPYRGMNCDEMITVTFF